MIGKKGVTLIELIIVVTIVSILATMIVPKYIVLVRKANTAAEVAAAAELANAINIHNMQVYEGYGIFIADPSDASTVTLGNLYPIFDDSIIITNVSVRISIINNVASVTEKGDLSWIFTPCSTFLQLQNPISWWSAYNSEFLDGIPIPVATEAITNRFTVQL